MIPLIIKLYWKLIPEHKRRNCLFKESCSKYVMRRYNEEGSITALNALYIRFKQCRPGYEIIYSVNGEIQGLKLSDGSYIEKKFVTTNINSL